MAVAGNNHSGMVSTINSTETSIMIFTPKLTTRAITHPSPLLTMPMIKSAALFPVLPGDFTAPAADSRFATPFAVSHFANGLPFVPPPASASWASG